MSSPYHVPFSQLCSECCGEEGTKLNERNKGPLVWDQHWPPP